MAQSPRPAYVMFCINHDADEDDSNRKCVPRVPDRTDINESYNEHRRYFIFNADVKTSTSAL